MKNSKEAKFHQLKSHCLLVNPIVRHVWAHLTTRLACFQIKLCYQNDRINNGMASLWRIMASSATLENLLPRLTEEFCELTGKMSYTTFWSVWPDLATFRHFGTILKVLGKYLKVYLVLGNVLLLFKQKCFTIGQVFIIVDGQVLFSHLVTLVLTQFQVAHIYKPLADGRNKF